MPTSILVAQTSLTGSSPTPGDAPTSPAALPSSWRELPEPFTCSPIRPPCNPSWQPSPQILHPPPLLGLPTPTLPASGLLGQRAPTSPGHPTLAKASTTLLFQGTQGAPVCQHSAHYTLLSNWLLKGGSPPKIWCFLIHICNTEHMQTRNQN